MLNLSQSPHNRLFSTATAAAAAARFPTRVLRWRRNNPLRCVSRAKATPEMVNGTNKEDNNQSTLSLSASHPRPFLAAQTQPDVISAIKMEADAGRIPTNIAFAMEQLFYNYRNAILRSGVPDADEIILSVMSVVLDRIFKDVEDPFVFSPYHKAIREPFDYYMFALKYIRPLIDFKSSYVGNVSLFGEIDQKLQQGHNIIFISNHQTEADPAVIDLLLETVPRLAEKMICVAGDRVITDPLCKPFSKGRNLLCVYSKKHMDDAPELVEMKKRANTRSLKEMATLLREGSQLIWIAPSGGRDRPDLVTKEWHPAPFDASAVDNMRRLTKHAGVPGHIYPLAVLCYDIMPPPRQVEKEIGERREIAFHGTGLSVAPEIDFLEIAGTCEDPEEAKNVYTQALYNSVKEQYNVLKRAVHGKEGLEASTPLVSLSQPWS